MFKRFIVPACALLVAAGPLRAQEEEARAIIARAIKAEGGEEKLKVKAVQSKGKGTVQIMGNDIEFTVETQVQLPDRFKNAMQMTINNMNFPITVVFDGKKGWTQVMGQTKEFEEKDVARTRRTLYADKVATLISLKKKGYELSTLGETKVKDKDAVGVRVSSQGQPDVNLYFDKQSHLIVKMEFRTTAPITDAEATETRYFRDHKEFDGRKVATRIEILYDDNRFLDMEVTEVRVVDGFDDSVFGRPE
jgi:hypothetical protein